MKRIFRKLFTSLFCRPTTIKKEIITQQTLNSNFYCSPNAKNAESRGLFTSNDVNESFLKDNGFFFDVDFFKWLCKKEYILPLEFHHKGYLDKNNKLPIQGFYSKSTITYIVSRYDLNFLYAAYLENISFDEMMFRKGIMFCRVKAIADLIGSNYSNVLTIDCLKYHNTIYFSSKKRFHEGPKLNIVKEWSKIPPDFRNKNYKRIARNIILFK